ncbi:MAG: 6-bladed beta-propeller [Gemmatimonadaceae bacterium]
MTSAVTAQSPLPKPVIRDSARIRIVEYPMLGPMPPFQFIDQNPFLLQLEQLPPAFRIDSKPYLEIGGLNEKEAEELDFRNPTLSAIEMNNGNLIVNDMQRLMVYSSTGKFLHSAGRAGNGPGEFGQPLWMCHIANDRVLAWAEHRILQLDNKAVRSLGLLPSYLGSGAVIRIPSIIAHNGELYVANARTYEVRVQNYDGQVRRITRLTKPPIPITDKQWREAAESTVPRNVTGSERAKQVAQWVARKRPDAFPPYLLVRVDPSNRVWVSDADSQSAWTVFDSTGILMGRVSLPIIAGRHPNQLAIPFSDHIQVREFDSDGALHLRFYHIIPVTQSKR